MEIQDDTVRRSEYIRISTIIGDRLLHQRLQNRISLKKLALETKIGPHYLEAIEAGRFEKLPGGIFRRSFVQQYASAVDLDPGEFAWELNQLSECDGVLPLPDARTVPGRRRATRSSSLFSGDASGLPDSTIGSLLATVVAIMGCAFFYSLWGGSPVSKVERAAKLAAHTTAALGSHGPVQSTNLPAGAEHIQADAAAHVRVGLNAAELTWISISSDGKNVLTRALEPDETKIIEGSASVRLLVGNAGGLQISLNGRPIGPIGSRGQVRLLELTPAGYQIMPRGRGLL